MQIHSHASAQKSPLQELFNAKQDITKSQAINTNKTIENTQKNESYHTDDSKRQTYGLLVLELMSDPEYKAFQRATAGMSESEKMLAAQSLYSLTSFYSGKIQNKIQNSYNFKNHDFIARYKNAFASQNQIDLNT